MKPLTILLLLFINLLASDKLQSHTISVPQQKSKSFFLPFDFGLDLNSYTTINMFVVEGNKTVISFSSLTSPHHLTLGEAAFTYDIFDVSTEEKLAKILENNGSKIHYLLKTDEKIHTYNLSDGFKAYVFGIDSKEYISALLYKDTHFVGRINYGTIYFQSKSLLGVNVALFEKILNSIYSNDLNITKSQFYEQAKYFYQRRNSEPALAKAIGCTMLDPTDDDCIQMIMKIFAEKSLLFGMNMERSFLVNVMPKNFRKFDDQKQGSETFFVPHLQTFRATTSGCEFGK